MAAPCRWPISAMPAAAFTPPPAGSGRWKRQRKSRFRYARHRPNPYTRTQGPHPRRRIRVWRAFRPYPTAVLATLQVQLALALHPAEDPVLPGFRKPPSGPIFLVAGIRRLLAPHHEGDRPAGSGHAHRPDAPAAVLAYHWRVHRAAGPNSRLAYRNRGSGARPLAGPFLVRNSPLRPALPDLGS